MTKKDKNIKKKSIKTKKYLKNNILNLKDIFRDSNNIINKLHYFFDKLDNEEIYNYYKKNLNPSQNQKWVNLELFWD